MDVYTTSSSLLSPGRIGQAAWSDRLEERAKTLQQANDASFIVETYHRYAALYGLNPDLALGQFCEETGSGTSDRWIRQRNACGLGITDDSVEGRNFETIPIGIQAHLEHQCSYAYGADNCPVNHRMMQDNRHFFHDSNSLLSHLQEPKPGRRWAEKPDYVGRILAIANALLPQEAPSMSVVKPPMSTMPSPNKGGYATPHKPEAICWHVTVGGAAGSLSWLTNPASNASSNYLVDRTGKIYELVPPTESAWANGQLNKPDMANPVIKGWVDGKLNPNTRTISIECERITSANEQPGGFTAPQHDSLVALSAWLCATLGIAPDRTHVIGHYQIDSVSRQHCPGLAPAEWAAWIAEIAALVNPPAPAPSGMMQPVVTKGQDWGGKGKLISEEVTVVNDTDPQNPVYYSKLKRYEAAGVVMEEWREV